MKPLARFFLIVGVSIGAFGCLGAPAVSEHADSLDVVTDDDGPEREALANELWCPACVAEGLRARTLGHDVRFHTSDRSDSVVVEIDGVLACAGNGIDPGERLQVELEGDAEAEDGEDEGNPDPEPALDGSLLPSPAPNPEVEMKGEDEGNPDPEPALDQPLPGPGLTDPRHL